MHNEEERRMLRKELRKHLREAAELSMNLNQPNKWLEECITSWNVVADDNDKPRLTESQAKAQLDRIDWSEDEDFEEEEE
jgi:hypothetical protein